jgi:hypothetical protein
MQNDVTVKTNRHWREFLYGYDVPASVRAEYDWLDSDAAVDGWIKYQGRYSHISDYLLTGLDGWDGFAGDSYFSGVAIRLANDGERYQIALVLS